MQTTLSPPPKSPASPHSRHFVGRMTPADYHAFNRAALEKHELIDGKVYRRAGASPEHTYIQADLLVEFALLLRQIAGRPYRVVGSDLKVYVRPNVFMYPDLVVIPTDPQIDQNEAVRDPIIIVEVLSSSTRDYDKEDKFAQYQQIEFLQHYLLIEQNAVSVTHHEKDADGIWKKMGVYKNRLDTVTLLLEGVQIPVSVDEIYRSISFSE